MGALRKRRLEFPVARAVCTTRINALVLHQRPWGIENEPVVHEHAEMPAYPPGIDLAALLLARHRIVRIGAAEIEAPAHILVFRETPEPGHVGVVAIPGALPRRPPPARDDGKEHGRPGLGLRRKHVGGNLGNARRIGVAVETSVEEFEEPRRHHKIVFERDHPSMLIAQTCNSVCDGPRKPEVLRSLDDIHRGKTVDATHKFPHLADGLRLVRLFRRIGKNNEI